MPIGNESRNLCQHQQRTRRSFLGLVGIGGTGLLRPPGVGVTRHQAPTPIGSCTTISVPGEYVLTGDLQPAMVSGDACIEITADDVVLNGNGYTIDGSSVSGGSYAGVESLTTPSRTNIEIKNLAITNWDSGIHFRNLTDGTFQNIRAYNNGTGLRISGGAKNQIEQNVFSKSTFSIIIGGLGGHLGITSAQATIVHNDIFNNSLRGIHFAPGGIGDIQKNRIISNKQGIGLAGGYTATVTCRDNLICRNTEYGIFNRDSPATEEFPAFEEVVDARQNYWGAMDGPSSPSGVPTPLTDPVSGSPADGGGDAVSEGLTSSVSNVRFDPHLSAAPSDAGTTGP